MAGNNRGVLQAWEGSKPRWPASALAAPTRMAVARPLPSGETVEASARAGEFLLTIGDSLGRWQSGRLPERIGPLSYPAIVRLSPGGRAGLTGTPTTIWWWDLEARGVLRVLSAVDSGCLDFLRDDRVVYAAQQGEKGRLLAVGPKGEARPVADYEGQLLALCARSEHEVALATTRAKGVSLELVDLRTGERVLSLPGSAPRSARAPLGIQGNRALLSWSEGGEPSSLLCTLAPAAKRRVRLQGKPLALLGERVPTKDGALLALEGGEERAEWRLPTWIGPPEAACAIDARRVAVATGRGLVLILEPR